MRKAIHLVGRSSYSFVRFAGGLPPGPYFSFMTEQQR